MILQPVLFVEIAGQTLPWHLFQAMCSAILVYLAALNSMGAVL